MSTPIEVLVYRPGQDSVVEKVENTLEAQQALVGGYIEMVPLGKGLYLVCNEEGKLRGLERNIHVGFDVVVGNCFFCRVRGSNAASLSAKDIEALREQYG